MAKVSIEDVKKLANLSKLSLSEDELKKYKQEIENILGYVEQLNSIDTDGVEETSQVTGISNSTREDKIKDYGTSKQQLLSNSPDQESGYIKVRRVL